MSFELSILYISVNSSNTKNSNYKEIKMIKLSKAMHPIITAVLCTTILIFQASCVPVKEKAKPQIPVKKAYTDNSEVQPNWKDVPALKDAYKDYFDYFGFAVPEVQLKNNDIMKGISWQASCFTCENECKPDFIFNWSKPTAVVDFTAEDGIRHRCWVIDKMMDKALITTAFDKMDSIYIADGHHRAASAVKVGLKRREENPAYTGKEDFNFFLSVLFPDEELKIYDYNRVLKDLNGLAPEELLEELDSLVDILETSDSPIRPDEKGQWSMLLDGTWYLCQVKPEHLVDDPVEGLDVSLLQNLVLEPLLGILDPKTDDRIDFVGGIRGLKELERRCNTDCRIAFAMYPTSIQELFDVADAGLLMPPKSTWFEPKLRSGLFIHKI